VSAEIYVIVIQAKVVLAKMTYVRLGRTSLIVTRVKVFFARLHTSSAIGTGLVTFSKTAMRVRLVETSASPIGAGLVTVSRSVGIGRCCEQGQRHQTPTKMPDGVGEDSLSQPS